MVKFTDKKFMDERWRCLSFNEVKKFDFKVPRKYMFKLICVILCCFHVENGEKLPLDIILSRSHPTPIYL